VRVFPLITMAMIAGIPSFTARRTGGCVSRSGDPIAGRIALLSDTRGLAKQKLAHNAHPHQGKLYTARTALLDPNGFCRCKLPLLSPGLSRCHFVEELDLLGEMLVFVER
jgi:hypothetical protein